MAETFTNETEDLIVKQIFMLYLLQNVPVATTQFGVIVSTLWGNSGTQTILLVHTAKSLSLEEASLNMGANLIVRLTTINKLGHCVLVVGNQSPESA